MKLRKNLALLLSAILFTGAIFSCEGPAGEDGLDGQDGTDGVDGVDGQDGQDFTPPIEELTPLENSVVPTSVFKMGEGFSLDQVSMIMTSQDILPSDSSFVYGSYTDGQALYPNGDGSYSLIVNLERDYSIARIRMNESLQPLQGDYIVNSIATAFTAQCSGSSITKEEHGFGPLYLSGGEWGGANKGVYVVDPFKSVEQANFATRSMAMGEWSTENAVVIGKNAYNNMTVAFMGDDDSSGDYPDGHLGMYVGARGDLFTGNLFVLRGTNPIESAPGEGGQLFEMGMEEGTAYDVEWVAMTERTIDELNQEAMDSAAIGFQRIEDIDWRRGSDTNERTIFFCVTGNYNPDNTALADRGTTFGRVYMLELNESDPTGAAKLTCILDGDKVGGVADGFHSPDNILVTEDYIYIQEDPNGLASLNPAIQGWAKLYQYNISTGELKIVLECDEDNNPEYGGGGKWEITGLIDVTDIIGASETTFIGGVQVHGWEADNIESAVRADGQKFFDPTAIAEGLSDYEGSFMFKLTGIE